MKTAAALEDRTWPTSTRAPACPCCWSTASRSTTRCGTRRSRRSRQHARVIAPDLRGFGQSPLAPGDAERGISMEAYADDLVGTARCARRSASRSCSSAFRWAATSPGSSCGSMACALRALVQCDTRADRRHRRSPRRPAQDGRERGRVGQRPRGRDDGAEAVRAGNVRKEAGSGCRSAQRSSSERRRPESRPLSAAWPPGPT